jgi:hypothetical protein
MKYIPLLIPLFVVSCSTREPETRMIQVKPTVSEGDESAALKTLSRNPKDVKALETMANATSDRGINATPSEREKIALELLSYRKRIYEIDKSPINADRYALSLTMTKQYDLAISIYQDLISSKSEYAESSKEMIKRIEFLRNRNKKD